MILDIVSSLFFLSHFVLPYFDNYNSKKIISLRSEPQIPFNKIIPLVQEILTHGFEVNNNFKSRFIDLLNIYNLSRPSIRIIGQLPKVMPPKRDTVESCLKSLLQVMVGIRFYLECGIYLPENSPSHSFKRDLDIWIYKIETRLYGPEL